MKNETKKDALFDLIKSLVETPGPSGQEHLIREVIKAEIKGHCDEMVTDALGNLIARKGKKSEDGSRIMISAHMDEIGLMVTHIDENGFARFMNIGGINPLTCIGGRVLFMNGISGVIGVERLEPNTLPKLENLFIDTGAASAEESPVKVGDVAGFYRPLMQIGNRLVAKSMDDRIAAVIAIEAMKAVKSTPHELYFVFSVQEEVGIRGATTAAFGVDPDLGLAVDVTLTGDTPKARKMSVALGNGPAIKVRDSSFIADTRIVNWMIREAKAQKLPYQMEVLEFGGTDGRAIQMTRAGVPAGCLSVPCRYVHSPSEMVDRRDVENSIKLLTGLLSKVVTF
jgi:putative aminopeptidase FrvX